MDAQQQDATTDWQQQQQQPVNTDNTDDSSNNNPYPHLMPTKKKQRKPIIVDDICEYKLVIVGDANVGKSTFIKRIVADVFEAAYNPTLGCQVYPVLLPSNKGPVLFNCFDTAGQEKFGGLRDGYYVRADCAIIMFDVSSVSSFSHVKNWYKDITRVCGTTIPICLVCHKSDLKAQVKPDHLKAVTSTWSNVRAEYYSSKSDNKDEGLKKIFTRLLKMIQKEQDVEILEQESNPLTSKIQQELATLV